MNKAIISGKITSIIRNDKVCFATICTNQNGSYEYVPVTIFNTEFFTRYFYEGKWITIEGHIHINKRQNEQNIHYDTEIIADKLHFCGTPTEVDKTITEAYKEYTE